LFFRKRTRLRDMNSVMRFLGGGVFNRIDENRELLELLQRESPEFLQKHPWVNGWMEAHDEFYTELVKAAQMQPLPGHDPRPFPVPVAERRSLGVLCKFRSVDDY